MKKITKIMLGGTIIIPSVTSGIGLNSHAFAADKESLNKDIEELRKLANEYKAKGYQIKENDKVKVQTYDDAEKIVKEQLKLLKENVKKYEDSVVEKNETNKKADEVKAKNDELKKQYQKELDDYNKKVNALKSKNQELTKKYKEDLAKYEETKAQIEKENADAKAQYNEKKSQYENQNKETIEKNKRIEEENTKKQAEYKKKMESLKQSEDEYNSKLQKVKNTSPLKVEKDGIQVYGDFDESKKGSLDYYKKFTVVLQDKNKHVDVLKDYLGFHEDTKIETAPGSNIVMEPLAKDAYTAYYMQKGDQYIIKNVATLKDGRKVHVKVTIEDLGGYVGELQANGKPVVRPYLSISGADNTNSLHFNLVNHKSIAQKLDFYDDNGQPVNLLFASIITDIDLDQESTYKYNNSEGIELVPKDSGLAHLNNGAWKGGSNDLKADESIPLGSMAVVGYGSSIYNNYVGNPLKNTTPAEWDKLYISGLTTDDNASSVIWDLFGSTSNLEILQPLDWPKEPTLTPLLSVPNPPTEPNYKSLPEKPKEPTLEKEPNNPPKEPVYSKTTHEDTDPSAPTFTYNVAELTSKTYFKDVDGKDIVPNAEGTVDKKDIPNHKYLRTEKLSNGDTVHIYEKIGTEIKSKTHFKDVDGKEIVPNVDGTVDKKDIPNYRYLKTEKLSNGDTVHTYEKIKTYFKDVDGNGTITTEDGIVDKKDIPNYRYIGTEKLPNGDVVHKYEKIRTHFKDVDGKEIVPNADGTVDKKDIPNYRYLKTEKLPNGDTVHTYEKIKTYFKDVDGNGTITTEDGIVDKKDIPNYRYIGTEKLPNGDVVHKYEKIKTHFKDVDGKEIIPNADGTVDKKDIPNYRYLKTEKLPNGDTVHTYEKIKTHFKDVDGNEIAPSEDGIADKKEIPGYRYVKTEKLANGDMGYVYTKSTNASKVLPNTGAKENTLAGLSIVTLLGLALSKKEI